MTFLKYHNSPHQLFFLGRVSFRNIQNHVPATKKCNVKLEDHLQTLFFEVEACSFQLLGIISRQLGKASMDLFELCYLLCKWDCFYIEVISGCLSFAMKIYEDHIILSTVGRIFCSPILSWHVLPTLIFPAVALRISIVEFNGPQFQTNLAILSLDLTTEAWNQG